MMPVYRMESCKDDSKMCSGSKCDGDGDGDDACTGW